MRLRWFLSSKVRQTCDLCGHVRKLRNGQCDVLSPQALKAIDEALRETQGAVEANADAETLAKRADELEKAAQKWIRPYPNAEWRENIEVFLVAIVVAMAIRTFFLQPFKIPTSSMQPTLFGVTVEPLYDPGFKMPGLLARIWDVAARGAIYHEVIAPQDGRVVDYGTPEHFLRFFNKETVGVQYQDGSKDDFTLWFTPDQGPNDSREQRFEHRTGLEDHTQFHKGEPIIRFVETTGDHLFVDRLSYNFRRPERGEIVVFKTAGLPMRDTNQFYIKRLVGLPGEAVSIGKDRHARINGKRLDASTPHFENVYGFNPKIPPRADVYLEDTNYNGHVLIPHTDNLPDSYLQTERDSIMVRDKHYLVFGDNTVSSYDSRYWRDVPEENFIGKAFFVYWPITSAAPAAGRFGWGQR
ncbi:MAG: signal peptidase I [Verrucomicrobiota bacterium]|jgi:signal peptidase I